MKSTLLGSNMASGVVGAAFGQVGWRNPISSWSAVWRRYARTILALMVIGFIQWAGTARADFLRNAFGLDAPSQTLTFDEHVLDRHLDLAVAQYADLGVLFRPYLRYDFILNELPHITGHRLGNVTSLEYGVIDPFSIQFLENQTAAAFALAANPGVVTLTALLKGETVEEVTLPIGPVTDRENFFWFC